MNKDDFKERADKRFSASRDFLHTWRADAKDDFAFVAGQQWRDEDIAILEAQKRPPITFNYSEKMVDAVVGAEVSNRQEVTYLPRGLEDSGLADLWNAAAQYVRQECDAEDEESDAFRDALICGLGWTYTRMDYESNLDGDIVIERIDPLEMTYDPASSKTGLKDRRWHDRMYWVDNDEVKRRWPKAIISNDPEENTSKGVITQGQRYQDDMTSEMDRHKDQTQIRFHEFYELEDVYRTVVGTQLMELTKQQFDQANAQLGGKLQYVKQKKKVYYRAYFADDTLLQGPERSPCQEGFCINAITCKRDRNKNTWYGMTRVMKDPQRWANKWLSQILHIINTNAKGGLMAEIGAFVDPSRAQDEWSQPDSITLFNEGALSGKKVVPKPVANYPTGLDKLMTFALDSLPMVTGINLEALGLANRDQAGVVENQRKQAAYGLLSPMFNALRHYRKEQGRVLLYFIRNYISDGRLIRIGGPENEQYLPLTKGNDAARYDVIVDQSPNSPDTKQKTWDALTEIIPAMLKAGVPIPPDVLDYSPLPSALAAKWKQFMGQQQQMNQEMQQQMQDLQDENNQLKNDQAVKMQELQLKQYEMEQELQLEQQKAQAQIQMDRETHQQKMELETEKAKSQFALESFKQSNQMELDRRQADHERTLQSQQLDNSFKVKAFEAGMKPDDAGKFQVDVNTGDISDVISQFAQASQQLAQQAQQSQQMTLAAIQRLSDTLARPRMIQYDQMGRPVGSSVQ